ncbi:flavodoxin family protein [Amycolatopsis sp. NPDC059657]|uniref:flavodoxin family protein n=1 Tax=Amycolatopsis sp. NPDC059657 TaxID=3346899 RepID=UPI00366AAE76
MMRAIVVFESMFGNTEQVARAIADGLSDHAEVEIVNVDNASGDLAGVDLLVVGGPTHVHGLSRPSSRDAAREQAEDGIRSTETGLREWLKTLRGPKGVAAATFDTRLDKPAWLTGSAAKGAAKALRRSGCRVIASPVSFFVDPANVLLQGERERAREWGGALGKARGHARHDNRR